MADDPNILRMTPARPPGDPWKSFPAFAGWAEAQTPKDDPDGLRGVRTATALAGSVGLLCRAVIARLDPRNDQDETLLSIQGEVARTIHCATVLADEIGFNPIRTVFGPIDPYAVPYNTAYGIADEIPHQERAYILQNILIRAAGHFLPVVYAYSIDHFTNDGIRREEAAGELLIGVHELHTLLTAYDVKLSDCLRRHVEAVALDQPPTRHR